MQVLLDRIPYHLKGKGKASVSGSNESTVGTTDEEDNDEEHESSSDSVAETSDSLSSVDIEQLYDSTDQEIKQIHNNIVQHIRKANKLGRRSKYNFFMRQLETVRYVINTKGDEDEEEVSGEEDARSGEEEEEGEGEEEEEEEANVVPQEMPMSADEIWNEYENLRSPDQESANEDDAMMDDHDDDDSEAVNEQHFEDENGSQQSDTDNTPLTAEEAATRREVEQQVSEVAARLVDKYSEGRRSFVYVDSRAMNALPTPDGSDESEDGMDPESEAIVDSPAPAISKYFLIAPPSPLRQRSPSASYSALPPPPFAGSDNGDSDELQGEEVDDNEAPSPPSRSQLSPSSVGTAPVVDHLESDPSRDEGEAIATSTPHAQTMFSEHHPSQTETISSDGSSELQPIEGIELADSDHSDQELLSLAEHVIEDGNEDESDEVLPTEVVSAVENESLNTMVDSREAEVSRHITYRDCCSS